MTAGGDAARRLRFGAQRAARRAGVALPGPLRRSMRRAREAIAPPRPPEQRLSPPLGEEDVMQLYERSILQQSFYDETYAADLLAASPVAHDDLARALVHHLAPRTALDVGCGLGELVARLRARGVDAAGCDFSRAFLRLAPRRARPHLRQEDVTALSYPDRAFDVVTCMELLEHLPVPLIDGALENLRRVTGGTLIVTTPSFGPDGSRRHGLPINEPDWWEDARANRHFRRIVVGADGLPDCGHLTLATFRWWTDRFLRHGLARDCDLELALLDAGARPLRRHGWNLYALHEVRSPAYVVGETDHRQGGEGLGPVVGGPGGRRGRLTAASAALHLRPEPGWRRAALVLSVWAGSEPLVFDRRLDVTVAAAAGQEDAAAIRTSFLVAPGGWRELVVPDVALDGGIVRVSLATEPVTLPARLSPRGAIPGPAVGVCLAEAALVPAGERRGVAAGGSRAGPAVLETPELRLLGIERRHGAAELTVAVTGTPALAELATQAEAGGATLRLGAHLIGEDGADLRYDGPRSAPIDRRWLHLGSTVRRLTVERPAPWVQVELVAEGLWWGAEAGLAPLEAPLPAIEPPARSAALPGPAAPPELADVEGTLRALLDARLEGVELEALAPYARAELPHLLMVAALLDERPPERALEVNAYPFLLSLLLRRRFPDAVLERTNGYAGAGGAEIEQPLVDPAGARVGSIRSRMLDPEAEPLPFADGSFDTALLWGALGFLARDPAHTLAELHRVLAPGGRLVLGTPNIASASNERRLAERLGVGRQLAASGPGARPLRDYAAEEVFELLAGNGFAIDRHLTRSMVPLDRLDAAWFAAADDDGAGDNHFVVARRTAPAGPSRPDWLYRWY